MRHATVLGGCCHHASPVMHGPDPTCTSTACEASQQSIQALCHASCVSSTRGEQASLVSLTLYCNKLRLAQLRAATAWSQTVMSATAGKIFICVVGNK